MLDEGESSEIDIQGDIELALIQMKAETLNSIDAALHRIEEGNYGYCFECGGEIAEARLRALPFAVRCRGCEEVREGIDHRERWSVQRRGSQRSSTTIRLGANATSPRCVVAAARVFTIARPSYG